MADGFNIHLEGVDEFTKALESAVVKANLANKVAITKAANIVKKTAQTALALRSHRKGTWSPSPPGDAPALVSGALRRSINVDITNSGFVTTAKIGPTIIYGRIQELGGPAGRGHSVHLPPRPYMAPSLEFSRPLMSTAFAESWSTIFTKL